MAISRASLAFLPKSIKNGRIRCTDESQVPSMGCPHAAGISPERGADGRATVCAAWSWTPADTSNDRSRLSCQEPISSTLVEESILRFRAGQTDF